MLGYITAKLYRFSLASGDFASLQGYASLPTFTFYLHDGAGTIPAFEIEPLDRDEDAIDFGRRLLSKRPRYSHVEITEGDRPVASIARDPGAGAT